MKLDERAKVHPGSRDPVTNYSKMGF